LGFPIDPALPPAAGDPGTLHLTLEMVADAPAAGIDAGERQSLMTSGTSFSPRTRKSGTWRRSCPSAFGAAAVADDGAGEERGVLFRLAPCDAEVARKTPIHD